MVDFWGASIAAYWRFTKLYWAWLPRHLEYYPTPANIFDIKALDYL